MKALKIVLGLIYPILIILLLLLGMKKCDKAEPADNDRDSTEQERPRAERSDSTDVERAEHVGASGELKITLLWDFGGDIDLHVATPENREIYFGYKRDRRSGGELDTDNQHGGNGAAENIYFSHPPKGTYTVGLHYYQHGDGRPEQSGECKVIVFQKGQEPKEYRVHMGTPDELKEVTTVTIR